jgi:hypothetical protein
LLGVPVLATAVALAVGFVVAAVAVGGGAMGVEPVHFFAPAPVFCMSATFCAKS